MTAPTRTPVPARLAALGLAAVAVLAAARPARALPDSLDIADMT